MMKQGLQVISMLRKRQIYPPKIVLKLKVIILEYIIYLLTFQREFM